MGSGVLISAGWYENDSLSCNSVIAPAEIVVSGMNGRYFGCGAADDLDRLRRCICKHWRKIMSALGSQQPFAEIWSVSAVSRLAAVRDWKIKDLSLSDRFRQHRTFNKTWSMTELRDKEDIATAF